MATVVIMKWEGILPDQYELCRKIINWEGSTAKGSIFHVVAFHGNEMRVTDIWESEEDFTIFLQSRLIPGVAQIGITSLPQIEIFPLHAVFIPDEEKLKALWREGSDQAFPVH